MFQKNGGIGHAINSTLLKNSSISIHVLKCSYIVSEK